MVGSLAKKQDILPKKGESSKDQAKRVFDALINEIKQNPDKKIALLYSANNDQAESLHKARQQNKTIPDISGAGQAELFHHLVTLINKAVKDNVISNSQIIILPVATSLHGGNNTPGNQVAKVHMDRDLGHIADAISTDYEVYGIPGKSGSYAIGGGVSQNWNSQTFDEIGGKTQGDYVQELLKQMELNPEQAQTMKLPEQAQIMEPKVNPRLSALEAARSKGLSKEWKRLKDQYLSEARDYVKKGQPVPDEIETALKAHYNPKGTLTYWVASLFGRTVTAHWQELIAFQNNRIADSKFNNRTDYLATLQSLRQQGLSTEWKRLKDDLLITAVSYMNQGKKIPPYVEKALTEHYNPPGSLTYKVASLFGKTITNHWQEATTIQKQLKQDKTKDRTQAVSPASSEQKSTKTQKKTELNVLGGLLSDHAYQSSKFQVLSPDQKETLFELSAGTYNTQDRCRSKLHNGNVYANNPYDADETNEQYKARKQEQISKLVENIRKGDDIVFLQEVDFLFGHKTDTAELKAIKKDLQNTLESKLNKLGYGIVKSKFNKDPSQQNMATLYNKNKLTLKDSQGALATDYGTYKQYRGFETTFSYKDKNNQEKTLVATNVHLGFGKDYGQSILDYQNEQAKKGVIHVMGGDTNNVQNENLKTALGDWNHATNFSSENNQYKKMTIEHTMTVNGKQKQASKAYDRFFAVAPAEGDMRITPNKDRTEQIVIDKHSNKPSCNFVSDAKPSIALKGQPWQRTVDMLKSLDDKFPNATKKEQLGLLKQIHEVVVAKNYKDQLKPNQLPNTYDDYIKAYPTTNSKTQEFKNQINQLKNDSQNLTVVEEITPLPTNTLK